MHQLHQLTPLQTTMTELKTLMIKMHKIDDTHAIDDFNHVYRIKTGTMIAGGTQANS